MKSKLCLPGSLAALFLSLSLGLASAQSNPSAFVPGQIFDPTTGMPLSPAPDWKDANWKNTNWIDPDITLTNVAYEGVGLADAAGNLREQFKEQFDVLLPGDTASTAYMNGQSVPANWQTDWRNEPIHLRLKNVSASEVFEAMNLLFENNRTPLRWELKAAGHRRIALLRVIVDPVAKDVEKVARRIYFVGDLIGDEKSGGMTMEQITQTVHDIWQMTDVAGGKMQFHKDAQLLVVTGTPSQIDFMEQTLNALREKVDLSRQAKARAKPEEMKNAPGK